MAQNIPLRGLALTAVLAGLAGCSLSPLARRTSDFSSAAMATSIELTAAYDTVETVHRQRQTARLVREYDPARGLDRNAIQPLFPAKDRKVREQIVASLTRYAETLAAVSGDQPLKAVDTGAQALNTSLHSLASSDELASYVKQAGVSGVDLNLATSALDALGRALVERKRAHELPGLLKAMKEPVHNICALLAGEIGEPGVHGLRAQLAQDYETLLHEQNTFIKDNAALSPSERRAEIEQLPRLVEAEAAGDRALAATQEALLQLARTHDALAETAQAKDAPGFRALLAELVADEQQVRTFYAKLPTQ